jgi:hypothetical protein
MRRFSLNLLAASTILGSAVLSLSAQVNSPKVSFATERMLVSEYISGNAVEVEFVLSHPLLAEVVVPFQISSASTATYRQLDDSDERLDGDYHLTEDTDTDDGNDYTFDPETMSGTVTLANGTTSMTIDVFINNDLLANGDEGESLLETIIFIIDEDAVTVGTPTPPLQHTLVIQDNDTLDENFPSHATFTNKQPVEVEEGFTLSLPIRLRDRVGEARTLTYKVILSDSGASADDFNPGLTTDDDGEVVEVDITQEQSVTVGANLNTTSIGIRIAADVEVESSETFQVQLTGLSIDDEDSDNFGHTFQVDSTPIDVTIIDNDPTTAFIDVSDFDTDEKSSITLSPGETTTLTFALSAPLPYRTIFPLTFDGTAIEFDDDQDDDSEYNLTSDYSSTVSFAPSSNNIHELPERYISLAAGQLTATLRVTSESTAVEDRELTIEIGLETESLPYYLIDVEDDDGDVIGSTKHPISLGTEEDEVDSYLINFPAQPLELAFGRGNPAFEDDPTADLLIGGTRSVISEALGSIQIPVFLSKTIDGEVSYRLEVFTKEGDAAATLFDTSIDLDEQPDWDAFIVVNGEDTLDSYGSTVDVTIDDETLVANSPPIFGTTINVSLNDKIEEPVPLSEYENYIAGTYTAEGLDAYEETIRFRISAIDANSPDIVTAFSEYELIIREMPDIDLTEAYRSSPEALPDFKMGTPVRQTLTGLDEITFDFTLPASLQETLTNLNTPGPNAESEEDTALAGYRSYKMAFRTQAWDPENPSQGDRRVARAISGDFVVIPDRITPFYYEVQAPYRIRFPASRSRVTLLEGVERPDSQLSFELENADTILFQDELYVPLELFDIDPDTTIGEGQSGSAYQPLIPEDGAMKFTLEFTNGGRPGFDLSRLQRDDSVRLLLSRSSRRTLGAEGSFTGTIYSVQELNDNSGRMLIEMSIPNTSAAGSNSIQIEYLNEEGEWLLVQPSTLGNFGSNIWWIDQGPPMTWPHPKDVKMRLYRIAN